MLLIQLKRPHRLIKFARNLAQSLTQLIRMRGSVKKMAMNGSQMKHIELLMTSVTDVPPMSLKHS